MMMFNDYEFEDWLVDTVRQDYNCGNYEAQERISRMTLLEMGCAVIQYLKHKK